MAKNILQANKRQLLSNKSLTMETIVPAVAGGILLFLSFPKYGSGFLAWIALIPLFWAIRGVTSIRQGLLLGFIAGMVCHVGLIYWITYVVVNYGYLPIYLGIVLMLLLACYLSIYTALFTAGIIFFRRRIALWVAAPVLWVCLEYCKSYLLTGFPWENLGYSQYLNNYLVQFADVAGVFGLSFLIVLANAALFEVISKKSRKEFILAAAVILIIAGVLFYGVNRSRQIDAILKNTPTTEVSIVQGNIDQAIKWNDSFQKETIDIYKHLSLQNMPVEGSLTVWPETALPFDYQDANKFQEEVRDVSLKTKSWFIFGSTSYENSKGKINYYNSAYLLSPQGEVKGKYNKVHLVPYGEFVPLRTVFPFINKLTAGMGDFTAGTGYYPLTMGDKKIGILICYEGILPLAAGAYKKGGAQLLVNITNDAWFGATSAPFQHFSMAVFRAVETRLYLVRAANTGVSAIVDPKGEISARTNIFERTAIKEKIKYSDIQTIYAEYGDILVIICCLLVLFFFAFVILKKGENNADRKYTGND
ncbi:MAG: apolipoprotein N-acyltransferase [Syntrophaceae bacterium]|nr:apolipoprotein N-acyltransferase [Syntrophaceae bacterium]